MLLQPFHLRLRVVTLICDVSDFRIHEVADHVWGEEIMKLLQTSFICRNHQTVPNAIAY